MAPQNLSLSCPVLGSKTEAFLWCLHWTIQGKSPLLDWTSPPCTHCVIDCFLWSKSGHYQSPCHHSFLICPPNMALLYTQWVYESFLNNCLEIVFLSNLGLTSMAILFKYSNYKTRHSSTVIYISTGITFAIFIWIIINHAQKQLFSTRAGAKLKMKLPQFFHFKIDEAVYLQACESEVESDMYNYLETVEFWVTIYTVPAKYSGFIDPVSMFKLYWSNVYTEYPFSPSSVQWTVILLCQGPSQLSTDCATWSETWRVVHYIWWYE